jgi:hypothetical protein
MVLVLVLPFLLAVAAVVLGVVFGRHGAPRGATGPIALAPVDAPQAASASCARLLAALPAELTTGPNGLHRLELATPAPAGAAAWAGDAEPDQRVVLRCGLPKPAELTPTSELIEIDQVGWLVLSVPDSDTFVAADRPVYIALTVPRGLGTGAVQTVSEVIGATLPATR